MTEVGDIPDEAAVNDRDFEMDHLRHEIEMLTKSGVIEVAVRNPSVMEYMRHWEGRTEKAEAKNARLREVLRAVRLEVDYWADTAQEHDLVARIDAALSHPEDKTP